MPAPSPSSLRSTSRSSVVDPQPADNALGTFLRAMRERLNPADVGLPSGARRRAAGLRREEVAVLCGISPTWYTWLEQGRTTAASADTLHALATGLQLSTAQRTYLFQTAGRADPREPGEEALDVRALETLVRALRPPAYVLDRHWDAVAWNRAAEQLFADWLGRDSAPRGARNLLRYVLLDRRARRLIVDWEDRARRLVAQYRADSASWSHDPKHLRLVDELGAASSLFDVAWRSQQVLSRESGLRMFKHPRDGRKCYTQFTLHLAEHADVKLVVLHPQKGPGATSPRSKSL